MDTQAQNDISASDIDIKALSALIVELNISRRNFNSYPKGHPLIVASFQKVFFHYERLLEARDQVTLGFAKDTLMVGETSLDKANIVFRDFARVLFEHRIALLTLQSGLTPRELENFYKILSLKREEVKRHGGIEALWNKARITAMTIQPITYDLFDSKNDDSSTTPDPGIDKGFWERFTQAVMTSMASISNVQYDADMDPGLLATALNGCYENHTTDTDPDDYLRAVTKFIRYGVTQLTPGDKGGIPYDKLAAFISKLNPDLRRQILSSTFELKMPDGTSVAEGIAHALTSGAALEILQDFNDNQIKSPPTIVLILKKLSDRATKQGKDTPPIDTSSVKSTVREIFLEHAAEEFVPDDYQQALNTIILENQIPRSIPDNIGELLATIESSHLESQISDIIMNLVTSVDSSPEEREQLIQNLNDMFAYHLQTGSYWQLIAMIERASDSSLPDEIRNHLRENYTRREFLDEILDGLTIWGKPRYGDIHQLISLIGSPFIEVLLDHLATEETMSLRRFMMDRLIEMGPLTVDPIARRLDDDRWFVLRNLLIILKNQNDQSVIPLIRPLARHANIRIRQEALGVLIMRKDNAAERQVLRDLDSPDRELQMAAVQLADKSRLPEIHVKLLDMLGRPGLSPAECELKSAVIASLSEMRRIEALPVFAGILASRSLFHGKQLNSLKSDIIRALERHPLQAAAPLLERLSTGKDAIAIQARETLKIMQGKPL
ncbi:MAG: HEAT repeat domain-containing protein [Desulfuromonadales bacterium]|nr:HEAT repeat domain-containing protein [Desulfuromonadales bacterium]